MSNNVPAPGFNEPSKRKYTPQDLIVTGVTTRGIPPATTAAPFVQTDWVTPTRARYTPQDLIITGATTRGIPPASINNPFNNLDWQVSYRNKTISFDQVINNLLPNPPAISQPAFIDTGGSVDRIRFNQVDVIPNNLILGIPPVSVIKPFNQTDWQLSFKYRYFAQVDYLTNNLASGLLVNQVFRNSLVSVPQPKVKVLQLDPVPNSLILGIPPAPFKPPFVQSDWANPVRAKATPQDHQISGTTTRGIPPAIVTAPFAQTDWQAPVRIKYFAQSDPVSNLLAAVVTNPFAQTDWPNPVRAKANPQDHQISGTTTRGIPQPVVPKIYNFDWPNPRRKYDLNNYGVQVSGSIIFNSPTTWSIIPALPTTVWSPVNDFQSDALTADNTYVTADSTIATADGYAGANQWNPVATNTTAWSPVTTSGASPPIEGGVM